MADAALWWCGPARSGDHGISPAVCQRSIQLGFSSVMMDGSLLADQKTPSNFEYNVKVTRETVKIAHTKGVSVEGELGCLGSLETGMGEKEDDLQIFNAQHYSNALMIN